MNANAGRERRGEDGYLLALRALTWAGAALVFVVPLAGDLGSAASAVAAVAAVVLAPRLAASGWRGPWVASGCAALIALGLTADRLVGGWDLPARLLGPGRSLALIEVATFAPVAFGAVLGLRTLSARLPALRAVEAAAVAGLVAYSFRSHRLYPYSQPQALSDWAFSHGHDPRQVIMAIGAVTLSGLGLLLLPRQGTVKTTIAVALLVLLSMAGLPLIGSVIESFERSRASSSPQASTASPTPPPPPGDKAAAKPRSAPPPPKAPLARRPPPPRREPEPPPPALTIEDGRVKEGDAGSAPVELAVTLSAKTDRAVTVNYRSAGGTASPEGDYTPALGTLTIPAGQTRATITVDVAGDTDVEPDETFLVRLTNPTHARLARDQAVALIVNDDTEPTPPVVSIDDVKVNEGNAGRTSAAFTVSLSAPSVKAVEVGYATSPETALAGDDFEPASGTLTIPAGLTRAALTVKVVGDTKVEPDESFLVSLSDPVNATLGKARGRCVIVNDDAEPPRPVVSVTGVNVVEGNSGLTPAGFVVTLSAPSTVPVEVHYTTAGLAARAGQDFQAAEGTVTFPPGQTRASIAVQVVGDTDVEPDEDFAFVLSRPINATLGVAKAAGVILDDDRQPSPSVTIADSAVLEGDSGTTKAVFALTLSAASPETVQVDVATAGGTATPGEDFLPFRRRRTVTFSPGETKASVIVDLIGDTRTEPDETFAVVLSAPRNATIARDRATGVIVNDDRPALSVADVSQKEGDAGTTPLTFRVTLSAPSHSEVKVDYYTVSHTAAVGSDYREVSGTLTMPPGATEAAVTVEVVGDTEVEADETFDLTLKQPVNATIARDQGLATVVNDDRDPPTPSASVADVSVDEGNAGTTPARFTVNLSETTTKAVKLSYATEGGTAQSGDDFQPAKGVLTIPPGQTTATVTVGVVGDTAVETDETFFLTLSDPEHATIARGRATATVRNDDKEPPPPVLTVDDAKAAEGNAGVTPLAFTARLSAPTDKPVEAHYATGGGTAFPGDDYRAAEGTLVIPPGKTTAGLNVEVIGDTTHEPDETFLVQLSAPRNASLARDTVTGTITNDDPPSSATQPDDEFDWSATGPPPLSPVTLVRFHDDYEPVEKGFYFRTLAYSSLEGTRLVRAEARDSDIAWAPPDDRLSLPSRPPDEVARDARTTVYLIGPHETPPALVRAVAFGPQENPAPKEFSGAFRVTSQVLADGRRGGRFVDAYEEAGRSAAGDPSWDEATRAHYLAVPDDPRYRELAREIGNTLEPRQRASALARVLAVRKWMEANLTYDYNPSHAAAADRTASFLFGDRRGYCTHLAHAMTLLLRAQGVPARVATGYRVGPDRRGQRASLLVYASDAHAWAEVHVAGFGWVVAESATRGRVPPPDPEPDPREHDRYLALLGDVPPEVFAADPSTFNLLRRAALPGLLGLAAVAILILYLVKLWRQLRPRFADPAALHRVSYRAALDRLAEVGVRRRFGETWDDFAVRVRDLSPRFAELTEAHLSASFGRGAGLDRTAWRDLQARVARDVSAKTPARRRWLGRLNPVSWLGVG